MRRTDGAKQEIPRRESSFCIISGKRGPPEWFALRRLQKPLSKPHSTPRSLPWRHGHSASPAMRSPTLPQQELPSLPFPCAQHHRHCGSENNDQKDAFGGMFPSPLQIWMETKNSMAPKTGKLGSTEVILALESSELYEICFKRKLQCLKCVFFTFK